MAVCPLRSAGSLRRHVLRASIHYPPLRPSSTLSPISTDLRHELLNRRLPLIYDYLSPQPSHLLSLSLADFLPAVTPTSSLVLPSTKVRTPLPQSHHIIYFPPQVPSSHLLPDGTDPLQSPGPPFVRRMWAGGEVTFHPRQEIHLDGSRAVCVERISDVNVKGSREGEEKIFVGIERRIGVVDEDIPEEDVRERFPKMKGQGDSVTREGNDRALENAAIVERRTLVFMRDRPVSLPSTGTDASTPKPGKILRPPHQPTFSHRLTPTPQLLFRFSALTFNAHAIHLDREYCRALEGHRDLLVHGPLSFTLLLSFLTRRLEERRASDSKEDEGTGGEARWTIRHFEYRNLAPLYAGEEMRLCGREVGEKAYEMWIENGEGGYAVKGMARVERVIE
ncbi:MAG: hypothetical protein M1817_006594 [Caeruleum heppii]|nr:MAG: hypothetical protein M1817_006594 [Caeruleum heppii]